jgi:hypothetical protein
VTSSSLPAGGSGTVSSNDWPWYLRSAARRDLDVGMALGGEQRGGLALERGRGRRQLTGCQAGEGTQERADQVVLHLRLEQAERAPHAGRRGHEHGRDLERARHLRGEERAIAAEGDERELLRVAPALDAHRAHGARHPGAAEEIHAVRGFEEPDVEARGNLFGERAPARVGIEAQPARQPLLMQIAEAHVGVGERHRFAPESVAHRPRHRPRTVRTDVERPAPSTLTMLPPPAPTSAMSMAGTRSTKPPPL